MRAFIGRTLARFHGDIPLARAAVGSSDAALLAAVAAVVLSTCLELSCAWFGRVI